MSLNNQVEKTVKVYPNNESASIYVAQRIALLINQKKIQGEKLILGLATGSTPKLVYRELIRLHRYEGLSFRHVVTFNLDEYYPMQPVDEQSYSAFMNANLFDHVDILSENIHIPNGTLSMEQVEAHCDLYEKKIKDFGGLDLQLLGIGRTGHIGFNEPGSELHSATRLVTLNDITIEDAIMDFGSRERVPKQAITMGIKTITQAKEIILLALSQRKAEIIHQALEGMISAGVPATYLQQFKNVEYVLDQEAASRLTR
ncbi:glucosamine-6-phosphate deaminase [Flavobacterium sp. HSC-61S13]|uniref:glucosamine-6-phosphate deaminase n=1 Tax=Flavobacterium sp. HSC-61S13 TaxID=2910963 RepID=UPI00209ED9D2|nr:glucosamine-6-phosphate deaminase [Flavobacterium sp. HSC-61S13]MCP1997439.1 glucosamine-6-phosphate deaminase [Flavobacterium sp. HSC-61S13]